MKKKIRKDEQLYKEIEKAASRFSQHLMSNSKWVRLIDKLVENADKIKKVEFKRIQNNRDGELYLAEDFALGFEYWQTGFEGCNSTNSWLLFKEIEYLIFPKIVDRDNHVEQDLEQIAAIINSVGEFSLDMDEDRLKLSCYLE